MTEYTESSLRDRCEKGREVGRPTDRYLSVTGEPYVVIGSQISGVPSEPGTVDEGFGQELGFDEETAYFQAWACFETYAHDKTGKLYWRIPPRLERYPRKNSTKCMFYMRCLISDKPEMVT
jgi:hypothetical protein